MTTTAATRAGFAQTVLGLVAPESLGLTLPHEHLFVDLRFLFRPPVAGTARRGALELGANRIVPSFPQLPPRPQAAQVHTTCEVREATSSRRSSPAAK